MFCLVGYGWVTLGTVGSGSPARFANAARTVRARHAHVTHTVRARFAHAFRRVLLFRFLWLRFLPALRPLALARFAGAFPVWLNPVQVKVLPITDRALEYADHIAKQLDGAGFRVEVDGRNEKIGKKIREATLEKIPYMLVVGDRDMENQTVSVRLRSGEDLGAMSLEDFTAKLKEVVDTKAIQ